MIQHSRIAKLYQYLHDDSFARVMSQVEAALDEGLENFDLEVDKLDDEMRLDLLEAFEVMGYQTVYDTEAQILEISID